MMRNSSQQQYYKRQRGVSLIELMISITIGLVLIAGVTTIYTGIGAAGSENIARTRLTQQMRATMDYMSRELAKAGYVNSWDAAGTSVTGINLDLIALFGPITVVGGNCILYSYDENDDGGQGEGTSGSASAPQNNANFELFGIKKDGDFIDVRYGGTSHTCDSGSWMALTDEEVKITTLTFELDTNDTVYYDVGNDIETPSPCETGKMCLQRRKVNIVLTGELSTDSSISVTLQHQVAVKNDYLFEEP